MSPLGHTVVRILVIQCAITLAAMAICVGLQGQEAAIAAGFGGLIGIIITAYFALRIFAKSVKTTDGYAIRGLGMTQISKYFLIFALFYIGLKVLNLNALPLVVAFMLSQLAYWLILIFNQDR